MHVYQFESVGGEDVVRGDDDGVEPDVGREVLPQPLVVPQVVRVLGTASFQWSDQLQMKLYLRYPQLIRVVFSFILNETNGRQPGYEEAYEDGDKRIFGEQSPVPEQTNIKHQETRKVSYMLLLQSVYTYL